jgi:vacuolar-type H+-ATPase subunit H
MSGAGNSAHVKFALAADSRHGGSGSGAGRNGANVRHEDDNSSTSTATTISRELRPLKAGLLGRRLSWMTVSTGNLSDHLFTITKEDPYVANKFKLLLKPPDFDRDDLLCSAHSFLSFLVEYIPSVKLDPTLEVLKAIRSLVKSPACIRLFGLLIHYQYWNVIYPSVKHAIHQVKEEYEEERHTIQQQEFMKLQREQIEKESYSGMKTVKHLQSQSLPEVPPDENNVFVDIEFNMIEDIENRMKLPQAIFELDQRENGVEPDIDVNNLAGSTSLIKGIKKPHQGLGLAESECDSSMNSECSQDLSEDQKCLSSPMMVMSSSIAKRSLPSGTVTGPSSPSATLRSKATSAKSINEIDHLFNKEVQELENARNDHHDVLSVHSMGQDEELSEAEESAQQAVDEFFANSSFQNEGFSQSQQSNVTEASLSANEKEQLYIQLEMCIVGLFEKV